MSQIDHKQFAIPAYSGIGEYIGGRQELYVHIPTAMTMMKLKPLNEHIAHANELYMDVEADNDVEKRMVARLKTVFKPDPVLSKMAYELAMASFNLHESLPRRGRVHVSTVTLAERRETCKAMMPRLTSIAGHLRAARMEYEQMRIDFKLDRLVFDANSLSFNEWDADEAFDATALLQNMTGYMHRLGAAEYELVDVDASPQAEKKLKTSPNSSVDTK